MGLGWWIDYKNPNMYYHGGNVDGFASMLAFDRQKKAAVVILANVGFYKEREELFAEILGSL
jgi:CubicO group peptidase (beta-lactamase class C family)